MITMFIKRRVILTVTEYNIDAKLNENIKFVFTSDLHDCDNGPIIAEIKNISPDAVLVGGDFIHDNNIYERGFEFLHESSSLFPTFCSIGNHERKFSGDIVSKIKESGAVLLDNRAVRFKNINIGGISSGFTKNYEQGEFKTTPEPDTKFLEEFSKLRGFKILLSHHPEYYDRYVKSLPIDLMLSGHAHGGQWRFFGRGVFAPGQGFFPKYTSGMYDKRLIVSRGTGDKSPIPRINNKTEILLINIT